MGFNFCLDWCSLLVLGSYRNLFLCQISYESLVLSLHVMSLTLQKITPSTLDHIDIL